MNPQPTTPGKSLALYVPATIFVLLLLGVLSLAACGQAGTTATPPTPEPYSASAGVLKITEAEPNVPPEGDPREPWLGTDAWIVAVQEGQEYISDNPQPQNVQVLTDMTTAEIWVYMQQHVSGALGVSCQYCHDINNYAADPYPAKISARLMLLLVRDMNEQFVSEVPGWAGNYVQCATCHLGQPNNLAALSEQNGYRTSDETGSFRPAWVLDTYAVHPDDEFVLRHIKTGKMLAMVHHMEDGWASYVLPRNEPIEPPLPQDRQIYAVYNETYYSIPNCYTCHKGNRIPEAAINRSELSSLPDDGQTVLPFVLRGGANEEARLLQPNSPE